MATAAGESALALVRISGPEAIAVAAPLTRSAEPLTDFRSHQQRRVALVDPRSGQVIDDALCTVMRAPRSYTGEDTVELSCHGSPALVRLVLERLIAQGARLAEPGEFTRRAFLNGRLDLAQAEAVALMISATTERGVILAARGLAGELSRRVRDLRQALLDAVASLEVALDFPDEDHGGADPAGIHSNISLLRDESERLVTSARRGRAAHGGLTVAIVGPPNAGKSSLFNALLGRDRAIVTPEAGTTRDVVEGTMVVAGAPVTLLDTAGLGEPRDGIDAEGMRRAREAIEAAHLLLVVVDGNAPVDRAVLGETGGRARIVVLSKSDLPAPRGVASPAESAVRTSVKVPGGLAALNERIVVEVEARTGADGDEGGIVASLRQLELLESLTGFLQAAGESLRDRPAEIALVDLRSALECVSSLLGIEVGDAVLDALFARFCVGK